MTGKPMIAIFAGFSLPNDTTVTEAASTLGTALGKAGYDIVYGGGKGGVVGIVIDAAQKAGADITAIVLKKYSHEEQFSGSTLICVDTEQERFHQLSTYKNPTASFALPGGPGTLREIAQAMENATYENGTPVILVAVGKYFDGIIDAYAKAAEAGLMKQDKLEKLKTWSPEEPLSNVLPAKPTATQACKAPAPCKKS